MKACRVPLGLFFKLHTWQMSRYMNNLQQKQKQPLHNKIANPYPPPPREIRFRKGTRTKHYCSLKKSIVSEEYWQTSMLPFFRHITSEAGGACSLYLTISPKGPLKSIQNILNYHVCRKGIRSSQYQLRRILHQGRPAATPSAVR